ncbi:MAG: hypothetical protein ABW250_22560 [Pyrinomonadaceae bacterium]
MRIRPFAFWLTAAAASAALVGCAVLLARVRRDTRRAAVAELRLRRTRIRLRTAEAELFEADEYLAATGELLECYMEEFGPLPVNPFARPAEGSVAGEEWQEVLEEVGLRED